VPNKPASRKLVCQLCTVCHLYQCCSVPVRAAIVYRDKCQAGWTAIQKATWIQYVVYYYCCAWLCYSM